MFKSKIINLQLKCNQNTKVKVYVYSGFV